MKNEGRRKRENEDTRKGNEETAEIRGGREEMKKEGKTGKYEIEGGGEMRRESERMQRRRQKMERGKAERKQGKRKIIKQKKAKERRENERKGGEMKAVEGSIRHTDSHLPCQLLDASVMERRTLHICCCCHICSTSHSVC